VGEKRSLKRQWRKKRKNGRKKCGTDNIIARQKKDKAVAEK
jgi:hypothetical protein